jgi:Sulfotransferase family
MLGNLKHFYFNKYIVSPFRKDRYYLSYCLDYRALWFRVPKVATRTIDHHFKEHSSKQGYLYSSRVGYLPAYYRDYLKFAFVRNPLDRLVSAWKNKVLEANYFQFDEATHQQLQSFEAFVAWLVKQPIEQMDEHILPQYMLVDTDNLDFLGRFESFSEDFTTLAGKVGLPVDEIQHKNPSVKTELSISPSAKAQVESIYEKDYVLFNY